MKYDPWPDVITDLTSDPARPELDQVGVLGFGGVGFDRREVPVEGEILQAVPQQFPDGQREVVVAEKELG